MKRKGIVCLAISLLVSSLCGCEREEEPDIIQEIPEEITEETGDITYETSTRLVTVDLNNIEGSLENNTFYLAHQVTREDGTKGEDWYNLFYPESNCELNYDGDYVDSSRQIYLRSEEEHEIPTLFQGDKLYYYSTDSLLDYINWERFYDLGYTIGIHNIEKLTNGRYYANATPDTPSILPNTSLYEITQYGVSNTLLDKIGGVQITDELMENGLLAGLTKNQNYDLEVYLGTQFYHFIAQANIHAFRSYELFSSVGYTTLQDYLYEIHLPAYFKTGYYYISGFGMFRYIAGSSYNQDTNYNEQLLFPARSNNWFISNGALDNEYIAPSRYSEFEPLNHFTTNIPDALGYVDESLLPKEENATEKVVLKTSVVKEIPLWLPEGQTCTVTIRSSKKETTGNISIVYENKDAKLVPYDRLNQVYTATFPGTGRKGVLTITGFYYSYDVELAGCKQYDGEQEATVLTEDSEIPVVTENEESETGSEELEIESESVESEVESESEE